MAEIAVSFLLDHLSVVLREEKPLLGGLEQEFENIRDELQQMRVLLRVADANEERNSDLKRWVGQIREISYDVEDALDKYMLLFVPYRGTNGLSGSIKKAFALIKNLEARRQIASEIQAIKNRLKNASESQQRYRELYDVTEQWSSYIIPENEWYDGPDNALFLEEADDVVGIEKPKQQLLEWIWLMDVGLEVISVVGMGGLGKTTLVKKVYDDELVKKHFNQRVWIVVSDYKGVKQLLANLIKKLVEEIKESPPQELEGMSVDDMRSFIYEFLKEKNYIIVLDDVWDISTWEVIKSAIPKRGAHGCIIITTRSNDIANAACSETGHVYNLEPLPEEESKVLFYKKAFPRNLCPGYLKEFAENILKRCEGLPLAIVVIGCLLATKNDSADEWEKLNRSINDELNEIGRADEWEKLNRSISDELNEIGMLKRLRKLLSLSYNDLPYYLKNCFLYLSIFPEGGLLKKAVLIRLWTTEGFVPSKRDETMEEVADNYLCELVSRSLIQVAETYADGKVREFRIHDLLREFITSKSREHNIVTIYDGGETLWPTKLRRLAVLRSINFSPETNNFECLRSLMLFCNENMVLGPIKELIRKCRLLKVLDLGGAPLESVPEDVFKLYHLKHLSLEATKVKHMPKSIQYLENLETLNLINSNVTELPVEILKLHRLRHLSVFKLKQDNSFDCLQSFKAPYGIGRCLPSLQQLFFIDADQVDGFKIVREIGMLTQLRVLGITKLRSEDGKELCFSIAKLTNLRLLHIQSAEEGEKLDLDYSPPFDRLRFLGALHLHGYIEKVPQWIASLNALTTLSLCWSRLREDPLIWLQDLPSLAALKIHDAYVEGLSFKAYGFLKLKELWLAELKCLKWVMVEKGSMPFLQRWFFEDCKLLTKLPQGIEHLTNLRLLQCRNMGNELADRVAQEKSNEGVNWRLVCVP